MNEAIAAALIGGASVVTAQIVAALARGIPAIDHAVTLPRVPNLRGTWRIEWQQLSPEGKEGVDISTIEYQRGSDVRGTFYTVDAPQIKFKFEGSIVYESIGHLLKTTWWPAKDQDIREYGTGLYKIMPNGSLEGFYAVVDWQGDGKISPGHGMATKIPITPRPATRAAP